MNTPEAIAHLAAIVDSSDDAILSKDLDGVILSFNRAAERMFGYAAEEIIGRPVSLLIPADRHREEEEILLRLRRGEKIDHYETVRVTKDGRLLDISLSVSPLCGRDGRIVGATKIARDITERKRMATALAEQQEWFRVTLRSIGDAVIASDREGIVTFLNSEAERLTGWSHAEAAGQPLAAVFNIVNEESKQRVENPAGKVLRMGHVVGLANHTALISRDGTEWPISDSAAPIRGAGGETLGVVLVFHETTELKRQEKLVALELEAMARLHAVSARLLSATSLPASLQDILDNAIAASAADFGNIQIWNRQKSALEIAAQRGFRGDFLTHFREVRVDHGSACSRALETGQRLVVEDVELDPTYAPLRAVAAAAGYRAVQSTPLKAHDGAIVGMLSTHFRAPHRISERDGRLLDLYARHAADLIERFQFEAALKEADRRKDEFLATLAHELRNPLAPVMNSLELMKWAGADAALLESTRSTMDRQLRHMVRLIDDLLDVSRITANKLSLDLQSVEIATVVRRAVEAVQSQYEAAGHRLHVSVPKAPIYVQADAVRLTQVLGNLLNNAAKFTPPRGEVRLSAEARGDEVEVVVKDNGIGIPREMLGKVFEMFLQLGQPLERTAGGLGIGLSLAKRLVELHGGTLTARSEGLGRGSEFIVRLPALAERPADAAPAPLGVKPILTGKRALIVDDNEDSAKSLAQLMRFIGAEVETASEGVEALERASELRPDVVLLDIGLPKMDGYEVCRRIRRQAWGKDAIVIALTGWGQASDRRQSQEAGFSAHLVKPAYHDVLMTLLARLLSGDEGEGGERADGGLAAVLD